MLVFYGFLNAWALQTFSINVVWPWNGGQVGENVWLELGSNSVTHTNTQTQVCYMWGMHVRE